MLVETSRLPGRNRAAGEEDHPLCVVIVTLGGIQAKLTGPLIAGLLVSDRVGAGIGAELGAMRATEQIDALEASASTLHDLVVTRVIASGNGGTRRVRLL